MSVIRIKVAQPPGDDEINVRALRKTIRGGGDLLILSIDVVMGETEGLVQVVKRVGKMLSDDEAQFVLDSRSK